MKQAHRPTQVCFARTPQGQLEAHVLKAGRTEPIVCKVLGTMPVKHTGLTAIYLDRFVHTTEEDFAGYTATGAISTVLTGIAPSI